jgi:hypothetical protein
MISGSLAPVSQPGRVYPASSIEVFASSLTVQGTVPRKTMPAWSRPSPSG